LKWTPLLDELLAWERLREHPVPGRDVVRRDGPAAPAAGDLERQRLAAEVGGALPVLAPVPAHRDPPGPRPLHLHGGHLAVRAHVGDQHLDEVAAAGDPEPHASCPVTAHPAPFTSKVGCISIVLYCTHSERNALVVLILVEWLLCWKEISTST
jgi:hypothetical protein